MVAGVQVAEVALAVRQLRQAGVCSSHSVGMRSLKEAPRNAKDLFDFEAKEHAVFPMQKAEGNQKIRFGALNIRPIIPHNH